MDSRTRVHFWAADSAGCAAFRCRWVADALNKTYGSKVRVSHSTLMSKDLRDKADVIVGQRICIEGPSHFWQQWSEEGSKLLVLELDDDLFTVPESNARASATFNTGGYRKRLIQNILVSDWVTVSTQPLKEAIHKNTGFPLERIVVIPNALPRELLVPEESIGSPKKHTLGYLCSPTHSEDFAMMQRHLKRFLENNEGTSFHTVGKNYGELLGLPGSTVHTPWVKSPEDAIKGIDYGISICPLVPSVFNKSKSDCKFLEASARGAVTVASDVSAYDSVVDSETGYKVRREHEWGKTLERVYADSEDRLRVARNAHAYVRDNRTTDHTAPLWFDVLTGGK